MLLEQERRGHQDPRRAEPALEAEVLVERLLERVEGGAVSERLDRADIPTVHLHGQSQARPRGPAVEQDGARAADAVLAADVRAVERQLVAEGGGGQEAPRPRA